MSIETDDLELAAALFGSSGQNRSNSSSVQDTSTGTAASDSSGGTVTVNPDGLVAGEEAPQVIELPTWANVKAGDKVNIQNIKGTSVVIGVTGSADRTQKAAEDAQESATNAQTFVGTCSTSSSEAAKEVIGVADFSLVTGICIVVTFSESNVASNPTLNVNDTGAIPMILNGGVYAYWVSGSAVQFVYDGTSWQVCNTPLYGITAEIGNPAGGNVFVDSDSVDIRRLESVLASFEASKISLGANSEDAVIDFCGGTGSIGVVDALLLLFADAVGIKGNDSATVIANGLATMLSEHSGTTDYTPVGEVLADSPSTETDQVLSTLRSFVKRNSDSQIVADASVSVAAKSDGTSSVPIVGDVDIDGTLTMENDENDILLRNASIATYAKIYEKAVTTAIGTLASLYAESPYMALTAVHNAVLKATNGLTGTAAKKASVFVGQVIDAAEAAYGISLSANDGGTGSSLDITSSEMDLNTALAVITGTLNITSTNNASETDYRSPPLVVGPINGLHLELDQDEIIAKASATEAGDLHLHHNVVADWLYTRSSTLYRVYGGRTINTNTGGGTITLSEAAANFSYIDIFYGKNVSVNGGISCSRYYPHPNKSVMLYSGIIATDVLQVAAARCIIDGTTITKNVYRYGNIEESSADGAVENALSIWLVVGYK